GRGHHGLAVPLRPGTDRVHLVHGHRDDHHARGGFFAVAPASAHRSSRAERGLTLFLLGWGGASWTPPRYWAVLAGTAWCQCQAGIAGCALACCSTTAGHCQAVRDIS